MSACPSMTAIALAPAEPIGTSSAPIRPAMWAASRAGRVRLTAMRRRSGAGGTTSGASLRSTMPAPGPIPGSATAPSTGTPSIASPTWTAQSARSSPYSRVPSTGSMIHTRRLAKRSGVSLLSSESNPSSGRCSPSAWHRNSLAVASPALPSAVADSMPDARTSSSRRPATSARCAASSASVIPIRRRPAAYRRSVSRPLRASSAWYRSAARGSPAPHTGCRSR